MGLIEKFRNILRNARHKNARNALQDAVENSDSFEEYMESLNNDKRVRIVDDDK